MALFFLLLCTLLLFRLTFSTNITCFEYEECYNQHLYCADNEDCSIECSGPYSCDYTFFTCPSNASCFVNCIGTENKTESTQYGCYDLTVYAFSSTHLSVIATSDGINSMMESAAIWCPDGGSCSVQCIGDYSGGSSVCRSMKLHGDKSTFLTLQSIGPQSITSSDVYCPQSPSYLEPTNCFITVNTSNEVSSSLFDYTAMNNVWVYAFESFNDVSITCNYKTSVTVDCFYTNVRMYCNAGSQSVGFWPYCQMELVDGYSNFQCIDKNSVCQDYLSMDPTTMPTDDPTLEPTMQPTMSDNIVYVRDYGCDYGHCYNIDGDYTFNCQYNPWLTNYAFEYQYCCNSKVTATSEPTSNRRRRNLLQTPTASPQRLSNPPTNAPSLAPTNIPIMNPTAAPTLPPTNAPSNAPTKYPSASPTFSPSLTPSHSPIGTPSSTPTLPPSNAPTLTPTGSPTASPTFGPTCKSIEYSWNCFHGVGGYPDVNECADAGFDGNGIFDIGAGEWMFPYNLNFGDRQIVIRGAGEQETMLNYTGNASPFVGCFNKRCNVKLEYLTLIFGNDELMKNYQQIFMQNAGNLVVKNVIFDGKNYGTNKDGKSLWKMDGISVNVVFENCVFRNNENAYFEIINGADVSFINCVFVENMLSANDGMFVIGSSDVEFEECVFQNNSIKDQSVLFNAFDGTNLEFINCAFLNNSYFSSTFSLNSSMIFLHESNGTKNTLNIKECEFMQNYGFNALVKVNGNYDLFVDSSIFSSNEGVLYDFYAMHGCDSSQLFVSNCSFYGGDCVNSIKVNNAFVDIVNSDWQQYKVSDSLISVSANNALQRFEVSTHGMIANNTNGVVFYFENIDFEIGINAKNTAKAIIKSKFEYNQTYNHSITNSFFSRNKAILFETNHSLNIMNSVFDNNNDAILHYLIMDEHVSLNLIVQNCIFTNYDHVNTLISVQREVCLNPTGFEEILRADYVTSSCSQISSNRTGCDDSACQEAVCWYDPFCCNTKWDELCVEYSCSNPGYCSNICQNGRRVESVLKIPKINATWNRMAYAVQFDNVSFVNNMNTSLVQTQCIDTSMKNIKMNKNKNSLLQFNEYSYPKLSDFLVNDSFGSVIELFECIEMNAINHKIYGHIGNYLHYNAKTGTVKNEQIILENCEFRNNQMQNDAVENALIFSNGGLDKMSSLRLSVSNTHFVENSIPFIIVDPQYFDIFNETVSDKVFAQYTKCPIFNNENGGELTVKSCTFSSNEVDYILNGIFFNILIESSHFLNNSCAEYCVSNLDSALTINSTTIQNQTNFIQFGHQFSSEDAYWQKYFNSSCSNNNCAFLNALNFKIGHAPLCFYGMSAFETNSQFSLLHFGAENGSISYLPCNQYSNNVFPATLYSQKYANVNTKTSFPASGGFILEEFDCLNAFGFPSSCHIECNNSVSCFGSYFFLRADTISTMLCSEKFACAFAAIEVYYSAKVSILCEAEASCRGSYVYIGYAEYFELECVAKDSCSELFVNLNTTATANIICYGTNACDKLNVLAMTDNVTLTMHNFNAEVAISTPTGFIEDSLNCNGGNAYLTLSGNEMYSQQMTDSLFGGKVACAETTFYCSDVGGSCVISYDYDEAQLSVFDYFQSFMQCFGPLYFADYASIRCSGNCPLSPTLSPTNSPTLSPTIPTQSPSSAPSNPPTLSPSGSPTQPPSNAPSQSPSMAPSKLPTKTPTNAPTTPPTLTPSFSPSQSPSLAPSNSPSLSPSFAPSTSPSLSPSISPTQSPSNVPTADPTAAPSFSPTFMPTRVPTASDEYDSYIPVVYGLGELTNANIKSITSDSVLIVDGIRQIIEYGYFMDIDLIVEYHDFTVEIFSINDYLISDIDIGVQIPLSNSKDLLTMKGQIKCKEAICDHMVDRYLKVAFEQRVQSQLRDYFNKMSVNAATNDELTFSVLSGMDTFKALNPPQIDGESLSTLILCVFVFMFCMLILSLLAWLHNQNNLPFTFPGSSPVDNAAWLACFVYSIQVWDFFSDVNLSIEIFTEADLDNGIIFISGVGSVIFLIIPYVANLVIAARIKHLIIGNDAAQAWFNHYQQLFVFLVSLSGGCHPSLALIASNIFGLKLFNAGLTLYELRKLNKIKVIGTILMENLPQLFCQFLYAYGAGGQPTSNTILAFTASLLAVSSATLSYFIDRDDDETRVVYYYLSVSCKQRGDEILDDILDGLWGDELNDADIDNENDGFDTQQSIKSLGNTVRNGITFEEKAKFFANRGRTLSLAIDISEVFGIPTKNIEIGSSMITKYGLMTRVVHFVYDKDLAEMEERVKEKQQRSNFNDYLFVTEKFFISHLYQANKYEIDQVFRQHFELNDDFNVEFVTSLSSKAQKGKEQKKTNYAKIENEDVCEQIREWMNERDLDYDKMEDRKVFFGEFMDSKSNKKNAETSLKEGVEMQIMNGHIAVASGSIDSEIEELENENDENEENDEMDLDAMIDIDDIAKGMLDDYDLESDDTISD